MAYQLNDKIKSLKPYVVDDGDYAVRLDANESFLQLPSDVRAAIRFEIDRLAFNRYPDPEAKRVCESFAEYYQVRPELVTAGNGSDELISLLVAAFLQKGDTIVTLDQDFSMYRFYAHLAECQVICCEKRKDLTIDVDAVIDAVDESKAKMLIFSNPCNPTSLGLTKTEVLRIVESVHALVVLDEAYMDFWDESLLDVLEQYDHLVILRTCSKMLGFASVRLGFAVANQTIRDALHAVKSPFNVNTLTQVSASVLLSHKRQLNDAREQILASKAELYAQVEKLCGKYSVELFESRTNFITLRSRKALEMFERLRKGGILVRYLAGDLLRMTCGTKDENTALCKSLEEILNSPVL